MTVLVNPLELTFGKRIPSLLSSAGQKYDN
jgi:hypothetical protein